MSVAPVNRASNVRNLSGRHGSMFFGRSALLEGTLYKTDVCDLLPINSVIAKRFLKGKKATGFDQLNFRIAVKSRMVPEHINNVQIKSEIGIRIDCEQIYNWFQIKLKKNKICECISQRSLLGGTETIADLDLFQ